jgi:hypothetical protein
MNLLNGKMKTEKIEKVRKMIMKGEFDICKATLDD